MYRRVEGSDFVALLITTCLWAASSWAAEPGTSFRAAPYCSGDYADDFTALAPYVQEFERQPQGHSSSYCIRNTATYECLSYGSEGSLRRVRRKAVLHGTAFGYRVQGGETLLLTNQHVAEWPAVTDEEHTVEDVPIGCKRVADSLKIVDNEADSYERDDIPLTRVVTDIQLDVAVLKARVPLQILPWKIGRSAALREHNVVDIRGFPLGAFRAANIGKVVSAYDHDEDRDWDHDDFVVDALLSPGNSGSPVLALSCKTGEYELVGIYHANYTGGAALNVVVGIDQVRDLMTTLRRVPHPRGDGLGAPVAKDRMPLIKDLRVLYEPFFPLGGLAAQVRARQDGALVFELLSREFPLKAYPLVVLEDLPSPRPDAFGELGRLWFGGPQGLKAYARSDLESDVQAQVQRVLDALRRNAVSTFAYRTATRGALNSREKYESVTRLERSLKKSTLNQRELVQLAIELADRLSPHGAEVPVFLSDALAVPIPNPAFPSGAVAVDSTGSSRTSPSSSVSPSQEHVQAGSGP